ncbi:MAG: hypothetical protein V3W28_09040 [Thermoplasmata archaeon]
MSRQKVRPFYRLGRLLPLLSLFVFAHAVILSAGIAQASDVAFSEAGGELGLGTAQRKPAVSEAPASLSDGSGGAPWWETSVYLVVASLIVAAYAVAARKVPWLRPLRLRRP